MNYRGRPGKRPPKQFCKRGHDTFVCGRRDSSCKLCNSMTAAIWRKNHPGKTTIYSKTRRRKTQELVNSAKNRPCADCGVQYNFWIMQFDHLRDKKFSVSKAYARHYAKKATIEEIAKCDVVCANCHADRTYKRNHSGL